MSWLDFKATNCKPGILATFVHILPGAARSGEDAAKSPVDGSKAH